MIFGCLQQTHNLTSYHNMLQRCEGQQNNIQETATAWTECKPVWQMCAFLDEHSYCCYPNTDEVLYLLQAVPSTRARCQPEHAKCIHRPLPSLSGCMCMLSKQQNCLYIHRIYRICIYIYTEYIEKIYIRIHVYMCINVQKQEPKSTQS